MKLRLSFVLAMFLGILAGGQPIFAAPITSPIIFDTTLTSETPLHIINGSGILNQYNDAAPLTITIDGQADISVTGTTERIYGIHQYQSSFPLIVKGINDNAFLDISLTPGVEDVTGIQVVGITSPADLDVRTSITINDGGHSISNAIGIWTASADIVLNKAVDISVTAHNIKGRLWGIAASSPTANTNIVSNGDLSITVTGSLLDAFWASGINAEYGAAIELNGETRVVLTDDSAAGSGTFFGVSSVFDNSTININGSIDITASCASPDDIVGMYALGSTINGMNQTIITMPPGALAIQAGKDDLAAPGKVHISRHADIDAITKEEAVPGRITGNISVDDSLSTVHVNLTGRSSDGGISFYQGATRNEGGTVNLGLHNGAKWRVLDEPDETGMIKSAVTNLSVSQGGVIDLTTYSGQGNPGNIFRTLSLANTGAHIDGSMILRINTDLARGMSDKLEFAEGYDASGQTILLEIRHDAGINKLGDKVTAEDGGELEIIHNFHGGAVLAESNTYAYDTALHQGWLKVTATPDGKIRELELLASPPSPVDPDPPRPPVSTPAAAAGDDVAALRGLVLFTAPEMTQHLSDLQAQDRSLRKNSFWFHGWGGQASADSITHVSRGFDQNLYGVQLGSDFTPGQGDYVLGVFMEHAQADNSYHRGSGKIKGSGFGLYASWMPGRSYINIAAKAQHLDSEYNSVNLQDLSVSGDYDTWAYSAALEAGHRILLPELPLWIEPQAGITLTHIEGFSYVNSQNTDIHGAGINSALARAGTSLGWNVNTRTALYAKASILHDMGGNGHLFASADGNGITIPMYDMTDTWGEFTLGLNTYFSDSFCFFASVATMTGGNYNLDWTASVGIRYSF